MFIPQSPKPIKDPIPIGEIAGLTQTQIDALKAHWIISAQEFLALADLPSTKENLAKLLELDTAELDGIVSSVRNQLTSMRDGGEPDGSGLEEIEYASGALPLPLTMREEIEYEIIPMETPPPPALSFTDELPPIRNQGERGSCVAHAAVAVREFMEVQRLKQNNIPFELKEIDLSEQFVYWWCKKEDGLPEVSGTYPTLGMQCLVEVGVATEKSWPYNPTPTPENEGQGPPPQDAVKEAERYRIRRIIHLRPDDIDSMKAALLQGKSVMITIPMFDSWFRSAATRRYGKINLPLPDEADVGAHAMALAGYVDDEKTPGGGYFILRNAWKPWGMQNPLGGGLGTIPYEFLRKHNALADTGELLVSADVYIRDNEADVGEAPSRGMTFDSPDIWVRRKQDGIQEHQTPIAGSTNWLYVRVWNKGPKKATQVKAEVFVAPSSPSIWPEMWQSVGACRLSDIAPGESEVASLAWQPKGKGSYRILVRVNSFEDPAQHQWAIRYDNNIAQKNLFQITIRPGDSKKITFPIYGLPEELTLRHIRIDRKHFKRGRIDLQICEGQTFRNTSPETEDSVLRAFASKATEQRVATLTISMNKNATSADGGRIIISQQYSDILIGRMLLEVKVED